MDNWTAECLDAPLEAFESVATKSACLCLFLRNTTITSAIPPHIPGSWCNPAAGVHMVVHPAALLP